VLSIVSIVPEFSLLHTARNTGGSNAAALALTEDKQLRDEQQQQQQERLRLSTPGTHALPAFTCWHVRLLLAGNFDNCWK
jgi:hypothetical protein